MASKYGRKPRARRCPFCHTKVLVTPLVRRAKDKPEEFLCWWVEHGSKDENEATCVMRNKALNIEQWNGKA